MSDTVRRGRSKKRAKRRLTVYLTQEEYDSLRELAESLCRTASGQAVWEIQKAANRSRDKKEEA